MIPTQRNIVLLLISTVALLVPAQQATNRRNAPANIIACPNQSAIPDCLCEQTRFHCPRSNPALDLTVSLKRTSLTCSDTYDFDGVPNLALGNVTVLKVDDCIMKHDKPILQTLAFLGISNARSLIYNNYDGNIRYNGHYFEGLERLENLTLDYGVAGIEEDTFARFFSLKKLIIANGNLDLLPRTFNELRNLTYLSLTYNNINALQPELFKELGNLEVLMLDFNKIVQLRSDSFTGLRSVWKLNLQSNDIESIEDGTFDTLPELISLELGFNAIENLPHGLFANNKKLKSLLLASNGKPLTLPEQCLANLPQLKQVNLRNNSMRSLPETVFSGSSALFELILSYNKLSSVPAVLLTDQHQLQILKLDYNHLEEIPSRFLANTNELRTLDLSNNRLRSLSEETFNSLGKLRQLYLGNNQLQTLPPFIFEQVQDLEELYMQNNQLAWHGDSFRGELSIAEHDNTPFQYLTKLRTLQLSNNSISTIFQDWYMSTTALESLDLSFNKLTHLTAIDLQFFRSISVNLASNKISTVFLSHLDNLGFKPSVQINVDLNHNPLNCDCNVLRFVQLIQSKTDHGLHFKTDQLRCVAPYHLLDMSIDRLETSELLCALRGDNECATGCQCSGRTVDRTVIVDCSAQNLTEIPELPLLSNIVGDFTALELHVENNLLTELPLTTLRGYNQVTQLYASNNSIGTFHAGNIPARLHTMDLSQNALSMIDNATLEALLKSRHLQSLQLSQNRWQCGCNATDFLNFIQQNAPLIANMSEVRCHPSGKSLSMITVNDLCYEDVQLLMAIFIMLAIFGLLIGLTAVLLTRYRTEVKVWLFTHNLFLSFITETELDKDKLYDAFISYSHKDEDFITDELIPRLENEPMNFKTCWHVRDFMPGELIMTQIVESIEASRRTLIVLSKNFLQSSWAKQEFRQAHVQSMEDNRVRVIVVIYEDIGDIDSLDGELKAYLKTNTYVKWGDPWFWDKLRYAMPHPQSPSSEISLHHVQATKPTPV